MSGIRGNATSAAWSADVGYERFLAPEVFFHPEIYSSDFTTPLPEVVDRAIATSPIDTRRALYKNIVLSGGSTMFKDFGRRVERDIKRLVDARIASSESASGGSLKAQEVEVKVLTHHMQARGCAAPRRRQPRAARRRACFAEAAALLRCVAALRCVVRRLCAGDAAGVLHHGAHEGGV